jgi:hypothetical protein
LENIQDFHCFFAVSFDAFTRLSVKSQSPQEELICLLPPLISINIAYGGPDYAKILAIRKKKSKYYGKNRRKDSNRNKNYTAIGGIN